MSGSTKWSELNTVNQSAGVANLILSKIFQFYLRKQSFALGFNESEPFKVTIKDRLGIFNAEAPPTIYHWIRLIEAINTCNYPEDKEKAKNLLKVLLRSLARKQEGSVLRPKERQYFYDALYKLVQSYVTNLDDFKKELKSLPSAQFAENFSAVTPDHRFFQPLAGNQVKYYINAYDDALKTSGVFTDMRTCIEQAEDHIFITGWALANIQLHKGPEDAKFLADLLADAVIRRVKVVLMPWDNIAPDEQGRQTQAFQTVLKAAVREALLKKYPARDLRLNEEDYAALITHQLDLFMKENVLYQPSKNKLVTHAGPTSDHGKMLIVDGVTFTGGLDLTLGRGEVKTWHDSAVRIQGPAVKDSIDYFANRCLALLQPNSTQFNQAKNYFTSAKAYCDKKPSIQPSTVDHDATVQTLVSMKKKSWFAQFGNRPWKTTTFNPLAKDEIQEAYLDAILKAEHSIVIENQYLIDKTYHNSNLLVKALISKIIAKIKAGEAFHLYCRLPHRPEGDPNSTLTKTLLRKQWQTMHRLMEAVHKAAEQEGKSLNDYVTFFSAGTVNSKHKHIDQYTHGKLMIIDGETSHGITFTGSANLNTRSLSGGLDTEVAVKITGANEQRKAHLKQWFADNLGLKQLPDALNGSAQIQNPAFVKTFQTQLRKQGCQLQLDQKTRWTEKLLLIGQVSDLKIQKVLLENLIQSKQAREALAALFKDYLAVCKGKQSTLKDIHGFINLAEGLLNTEKMPSGQYAWQSDDFLKGFRMLNLNRDHAFIQYAKQSKQDKLSHTSDRVTNPQTTPKAHFWGFAESMKALLEKRPKHVPSSTPLLVFLSKTLRNFCL